MDEFYGRNLPAAVPEELFVGAAQLYGALALVLDDVGREFFPGEPSWSETDLVQATARLPAGAAWYVVDARTLRERIRGRTVEEMIEIARAAGGDVRPAAELPFPLPPSPKLTEPPFTAVRVHAAVTHTIGGLRIDERARVLREDGTPIPGLYAAGADAGGIFTGGYASGLAAALVYGRAAAEDAIRLGGLRVGAAAAVARERRRPELADAEQRSPSSTVEPAGGASPSRSRRSQPLGDQTKRRCLEGLRRRSR